jgi:lipoprotein NlpD
MGAEKLIYSNRFIIRILSFYAQFLNLRVINILITYSILAACSSTTKAPISSRAQPPSLKVVQHVVAPGETLYSIAWRYGLDYRGLAKVNGINSGFTIFPGQIIDLRDKDGLGSTSETQVISSSAEAMPQVLTQSVTPKSAPKPLIKSIPDKAKQSVNERSKNKSSPESKKNNNSKFKTQLAWRWPARGKVITNFHAKRGIKKGIDIEGKKGDSVLAAASGEVVFAGNGLRAYGNMVIIKHNEKYLSAYAYNHKLRVKEGQWVNAGQRIADIGSTGIESNGETKLHFQIRRSGKSIDPISVLPRR